MFNSSKNFQSLNGLTPSIAPTKQRRDFSPIAGSGG